MECNLYGRKNFLRSVDPYFHFCILILKTFSSLVFRFMMLLYIFFYTDTILNLCTFHGLINNLEQAIILDQRKWEIATIRYIHTIEAHGILDVYNKISFSRIRENN